MLTALVIQNVVLIDRLDLTGAAGLCALTGETGAGKSILLDALGLALGGRADASLVRHGAAQATVTATFDVHDTHPARAFLRDKGIDDDGDVILRRTLAKDGRGKAFINDSPVSVQALKELGALLVEIHGQFATHGLLDAATHRRTLDAYANLSAEVKNLNALWNAWRDAADAYEQAEADAETMRLQEEYLRHAVTELEKISPKEGEESVLAEKRQRLMNAEKSASAYQQAVEALEQEDGVLSLLGRVETVLAKAAATAPAETVARVRAELSDLAYDLSRQQRGGGGERLEDIEDRYFALRALAKKHRSTVDDLPKVQEEMTQKLRLVTDRDETLAQLQKKVAATRAAYVALAEKISSARVKSAVKLSAAVQGELPDLKLDRAKFTVAAEKQADESAWGPDGFDRVQFMVQTNPQTPPGPLHKIASGGETSRFMLALKVVLAATGTVPTLIFDEVDSGIGGGTADAVGERLARLAQEYQVLVVTHSPQVAARAQHHWHVAKTDEKGALLTRIVPLDTAKARQEEIARMLSGAEITKEARAQAARLLKGKDAA